MDGTTPVGFDEQSTRHTSTPKGRFVLRADSIRPYGSSGEAATIHPAAQLRKRSGGFYPPLQLRRQSRRGVNCSSTPTRANLLKLHKCG